MHPAEVYSPPVPQGPRAYRRQIRRLGPIFGLLPPAVLGLLSLVLLRDNTSTTRGVLGFLAAVLAAPGLLVAGAPMASGFGRYVAAVVGSAAVWLLLGAVASRRATRTPVASWGDYWKEYAWMAGAVWLGAIGALAVANLILGGAFL